MDTCLSLETLISGMETNYEHSQSSQSESKSENLWAKQLNNKRKLASKLREAMSSCN